MNITRDEENTKEQLVMELKELRERVAALEASQVVQKPIEALVEPQNGRDRQEDGDIYWKMFEQILVDITEQKKVELMIMSRMVI